MAGTVLNVQVEQTGLEERKAILKAVKCPGKTHTLIKNAALRTEYARELNDWRNQRNRSKRAGSSYISRAEWSMWRGGLESAFWALQKAENRAFLYEDRRVAWQLEDASASQTGQYKEYEAAVIAAHQKTVKLLARIDQDFEAGEIEKNQQVHFRRLAMEREETKIAQLQVQYGI